ncbi:hypothetical protein LEMLEM_LOCUS27541 [Lemmus lemmus]
METDARIPHYRLHSQTEPCFKPKWGRMASFCPSACIKIGQIFCLQSKASVPPGTMPLLVSTHLHSAWCFPLMPVSIPSGLAICVIRSYRVQAQHSSERLADPIPWCCREEGN